MAHHVHGQSHLVRRQRNRDPEDDDDVQTIVSVRVITAANTFTGKVIWVTQTQQQEQPKTLLAPAVRSMPATTMTGGDVKTTSQPSATQKQSATQTAGSSQSVAQHKEDSTLMVATRAPTPTLAAGLASVTASITAAAAPVASEGGMSGGAKAGLALGILVVIGALLVGILLVYRRKKKNMAPENDNEKIDLHNAPPPPPPQVQTAPAFAAAPVPTPSIRTERSMSTAPRLSLRPVTQFDPEFENKQADHRAANGLLAVGAAAGAQSQDKDLPHRPTSAWERTGASNAPAENPFNDPHQQSGPSSANPFGNNAAIDASQAKIPDSPPNASPLQGNNEFAPPVNAKSAEIDSVMAATAMATVPFPTSDFPAPPSIKAPSESVPPSPAWTEDLPASPGPAPAGPPPVAGAIVDPRSNSPAPPQNNVHRVQLDFKPSMQDELDLHAGQLVRMLHEYDDGWALCIRMDRTQQGVVPRTCLSKHPVKPRTGPLRQGPPPPGMRGPPIRSPMGPGGIPQPRPLSPASGRNSPHPPALAHNNGRMSPGPRAMSPGPRQMSPPMQGGPRSRSNSNAPQYGPPRERSNSNAPYAGPPRSMSPGPYGGGPQMAPPPQMEGRPRSNSAGQPGPRRGPAAPGPSPMNPNVASSPVTGQMPARKPVPGMAM